MLVWAGRPRPITCAQSPPPEGRGRRLWASVTSGSLSVASERAEEGSAARVERECWGPRPHPSNPCLSGPHPPSRAASRLRPLPRSQATAGGNGGVARPPRLGLPGPPPPSPTRAPCPTGLSAPEAGSREWPRRSECGGPWRRGAAGRRRGAARRGPGHPRDNAAAARATAGARAEPASPPALAGTQTPASGVGGALSRGGRERTPSEEGWGGWGKDGWCAGVASASREENGAWCKSLLFPYGLLRTSPPPTPPPTNLSPPASAVASPRVPAASWHRATPFPVLVLVTLVLYRIPVPFSPGLIFTSSFLIFLPRHHHRPKFIISVAFCIYSSLAF